MYLSEPPMSSGSVPTDHLPCLMPCSPNHLILFLPVPDLTSFHVLVHWMYFGDFTYIQECLHHGSIQWEGIACNIEYLRLNANIKNFLGNWYYAWLDRNCQDQECSDSNDSDTIFLDSDSENSCLTTSDLNNPIDNAMDGKKANGRASIQESLPTLRAWLHWISLQAWEGEYLPWLLH